jgi:hypothetical protein
MTTSLSISVDERLAIADTLAHYSHAVDKHDREEFVAVFAPDGYMGADFFGKYQGKDPASGTSLYACYDVMHTVMFSDGGEQQHHVVNPILTRLDGTRIGLWAEWMFLVMYEGVPRPASFGEYEDVLVRVEDRWLFESRIVFCAQNRGPVPRPGQSIPAT